MVWKIADETTPRNFKEKPSAGKVLATIFWGYEGVLLLEYCLKGSTATSASYFNTLIRLQKAIKSKHPSLLMRKVILLHNNATPHSAKLTQNWRNQLKWDVFYHRRTRQT